MLASAIVLCGETPRRWCDSAPSFVLAQQCLLSSAHDSWPISKKNIFLKIDDKILSLVVLWLQVVPVGFCFIYTGRGDEKKKTRWNSELAQEMLEPNNKLPFVLQLGGGGVGAGGKLKKEGEKRCKGPAPTNPSSSRGVGPCCHLRSGLLFGFCSCGSRSVYMNRSPSALALHRPVGQHRTGEKSFGQDLGWGKAQPCSSAGLHACLCATLLGTWEGEVEQKAKPLLENEATKGQGGGE